MSEFAHRVVILAVAILGCAVQLSAQEQSPVLLYYADAYADHYHVPRALFRAIVSQESNWNPLALSDKGAMGLMQLMPATAREYDISNPYAPSENLSGGAQYLASLLHLFRGDMRLVVAAYYCGPRHLEQRGLSYDNPAVVAYVESVRRRYQRELDRLERQNAPSPAGGQ